MLSQKYTFLIELLCCTGLMVPVKSLVPVHSRYSESVVPTKRNLYTAATKLMREPLNPCAPYEIEMPDFRKTKSTVSEAKCEEYKWLKAYRKIKSDREYKCDQASANSEGRDMAIGGRDALPGEFPHMAAIGWASSSGSWIFKCGGSLISPNYVLTAGHCTRTSDVDRSVTDPVPKIVRLGSTNIVDISNGVRPLDVNITVLIRHPDYNPPILYNDIALLKLEQPIDFTLYIQPACLWTHFDTSSLGTEAIITGWGVTEAHSSKTSPELQAVNLDVVSHRQCQELLRHKYSRKWWGVDEATQICAGKLSGGADSCLGDSGGPLQMKINYTALDQGTVSYVIGVTTFGFGCALPDTPGVYTRVSYYVPWIESVVWPEG